MPVLKDLFLLDPGVVYLNHGSFGATARPVFETYQEWQRRLERQPVQFLVDELPAELEKARTKLGAYLNASAQDLVFITNATYGVNVIARSLHLEPGDEVLATDHEYGACDRMWDFVCEKSGARYIRQHIPLPVMDPDEILEAVWQGVTGRTRLVFLSHITSSTALTLPVEAIVRRARQAGVLTLIDGAHAPGQLPLDLNALGADFYTGNCHKWMLAPKGSAFLYARPEAQPLVEPLVVSWGWKPEASFTTGSAFVDAHQWLGTRDPSAALSVPAAIQFMEDHDWPSVREACHALLEIAMQRIGEFTRLAPVYPPGKGFYHQMGVVPLPPQEDLQGFKRRLYAEHRIEVPCLEWQGRQLMRISIQGYNTLEDIERLVEGVKRVDSG
jgi:isopenicillin-N epimerase